MKPVKKLLIVEDEGIIALAEARVLRNAGYEVDIVHAGQACVEAVRSDPSIDLVLMDIDLGRGISGPEAAGIILGIRPLPIVFLTSHSERVMVERVRNITRHGYVVKEAGSFVLLSSIEMAFELFSAHEAMRRHSRRSEAMLEAIPDLMMVIGLDGTIRDCRAPPGIPLVVPPDKIVGTNIRDILTPEQAERHLDLYRRCRETGEVQTLSYEMYIDGATRIYELRVAHQDEKQVLALIRDITERVEAERQVRRVTAMHECLFENAPLPIALLDGNDRVIKANNTFLQFFGYQEGEVTGQQINDLVVPPELKLEGAEITRRVAGGETICRTTVRCRKDGSPVRVTLTASPIEIEGSAFIYGIYQPAPFEGDPKP
ncbi:MAG TPA: PAS domain S-box protein [Magnetospirillaceae bacterium]|nr:PAS domain S-box protein [Magnetospirillaceae bacterium]